MFAAMPLIVAAMLAILQHGSAATIVDVLQILATAGLADQAFPAP
jgi:hypothetical protein